MRQVSVATTMMPGYDHVSGLERLRGPVTVIRRCESLAELISVARAGMADVLLVAGDTEQLTLSFLESLEAGGAHRSSGAVVALSEVSEERDRLVGLGISVDSPEIEPTDLANLLMDATARARSGEAEGATVEPAGRLRGRRAAGQQDEPGGSGHLDRPEAGVTAEPAPVSGLGAVPEGLPGGLMDGVPDDHQATMLGGTGAEASSGIEPETEPGLEQDLNAAGTAEPDEPAPPQVVAVWGPAGSPGRTTVAVNLAVELALSGRRTLLIDLDTYAASAGVHLGLLDESAGIAQACRTADQGGITPAGLERSAVLARVAGTSLHVLTGLTRADRWPELRRAAVDAVLGAAAAGWDEVVLDCGFSLEEDEELSFDVPAPQRNATTLAGLAAADRVLVVGTGDPVGLPRLIRGLDELGRWVDDQGPTTVDVVVNQVRAEASGMAPQSQIGSVVERFGGNWTVSQFLPWDQKALDRALLSGQVLAEAAPKSPLRRAVAQLAGSSGGTPRRTRLSALLHRS
ncbi:CpaE family protein [Citricoccus sp. GCM10030269]|uniref:AAA family ATPase n=1 Tax=Citricoccus sp. GCM10030269 TaxID=3273388 RepID=UPI003618E3F7